MNLRPKFVTAVVTLVSGILASGLVACTGQMRSLRQGESRLSDMQLVKAELASTYLISLDPPVAAKKPATAVVDGHARELLNRFIDLSDKVLQLDEQKGIAVTGRDRIEAERAYAKMLLQTPAT